MSVDPISGCLLGTALGDALGLPYEGLSRRRALRLLGRPDRFRFNFGRGMVSDDTEHTCMVAQALISSGGSLEVFRSDFAKRLRFWLLGLPAGVGLATLRSTIRLWLGYRPERSGVFSAGNGPAMRASLLGAAIDDLPLLCELVRASSLVTHRDPRAEHGALAVAFATRLARQHGVGASEIFRHEIKSVLTGPNDELLNHFNSVFASVDRRESTLDYCDSVGLSRGVTGFVCHTVPVAIHAWMSHPTDFRSAVISVIECGGDADTTAAIVGGIVGAAVGRSGLPDEWLQCFGDWPRNLTWLEQLSEQLKLSISSATPTKPIRLSAPKLVLRNFWFLALVLTHGFRRLLPPY
ncbi:MAG: ADP-ribosylglycohydrolase family protein [Planctomycetia bacterium]|nr:ADP-ribosylglycohydrolase family protein [Planctomycetia bacterium]